jgi:hypothetical protein
VLAIACGLMAYIQFNPNNPYLSEFDSYYHVKMAELLQHQGVPQQFPWLYFTTLRDAYVDHHLLFHVLLIPFVNLFDPIYGAKLFQVVVVALAFVLFYLVLKHNNVKGAFWLSLFALFTMSSDFYFRMNFIRDLGLSLLFMMAGIYLVFESSEPPEDSASTKHKRFAKTILDPRALVPLTVVCLFFAFTRLAILIPFTIGIYLGACWLTFLWSWRIGAIFLLSAFYVWAYGGFMFLPVFAVTYFVARIMMGEKAEWQLPLAAVTGLVAGLVLNPYFPKNIDFLYHQIFKTGLGAKPYVGGEWHPYDTWFWVQINAVPIIIFFRRGAFVIDETSGTQCQDHRRLCVLSSLPWLGVEIETICGVFFFFHDPRRLVSDRPVPSSQSKRMATRKLLETCGKCFIRCRPSDYLFSLHDFRPRAF